MNRRRWFRFSLRTIFVAVTALCVWLGWETSVVRERRAALRELRANSAIQVTLAAEWIKRYPPGSRAPPAAQVSLVRRWFGDEAVQEIWQTPHIRELHASDRQRLARIFPEAEWREALPKPCHPGCFPRGTLVATPQGPRAIEGVQPGQWITAILPSGMSTTAQVQSVFVTRNRLWQVDTDDGVLLTTETQPLCLATDRILPAGKLQPADSILRQRDGRMRSVQVLAVSPTDRLEQVFNLVLGDSEIFVAGGFLARSKPPAATVRYMQLPFAHHATNNIN